MPTVSVVIPCFNLGRYLDDAVSSVLAQTHRDVEVLVVDDGSTDPDTIRTLDAWAAQGALIRTEHLGLSAARNAGIRRATGSYVCCLDADDVLEPTWLQAAVSLLEDDPDLAFVSHWLTTFGDEHWEWKPLRCDLTALLDFNTAQRRSPGSPTPLRRCWRVRRNDARRLRGLGVLDSATSAGSSWRYRSGGMYAYRRRADSMSRTMTRLTCISTLCKSYRKPSRRLPRTPAGSPAAARTDIAGLWTALKW